jgi:YfiH family protein
VGDDAAAVAANRARLRAALRLPSEPTWLEQVHGARVLDLDAEEVVPADGAVSGRAGTVCAVLTADCLPVLLTDTAGRRVGVAHAGWRGLLAGVLPAAVRALGASPERVLAWLGPAISQPAYEVGAEVRDAFLARDPGAAACFAANSRGRWQADLYGLARRSLAAAGVTAVHGGGLCTFAEPARFFSHRREAPCGRMATLIFRT